MTSLSDETAPSLAAISFVDSRGRVLTDRCTDNLPRVPAALKQIAWDVAGTRYLYHVKERSDRGTRAVLANASPRQQQRLWVKESTMDHFGDQAEGWD